MQRDKIGILIILPSYLRLGAVVMCPTIARDSFGLVEDVILLDQIVETRRRVGKSLQLRAAN